MALTGGIPWEFAAGEVRMELPETIVAWRMEKPSQPLERRTVPVPPLGPGDVLVKVAGCGLCHTDLSFLYGGVNTRKGTPITLGHEISGTVIATGSEHEALRDRQVVVPSVMPCGDCDLCRAGQGRICTRQIMPGNDLDGGFADYVVVPGRYLCPVDPGDLELWELSIVADAVSTSYQAIERAGVKEGDFAVVVGAGGVGGFAVQIAAARGAMVVAVDVDASKLEKIHEYGARATVDASELDARGVRDAVRGHAKSMGAGRTGWKIFEVSGTGPGQQAAFELLGPGSTAVYVGYSNERVPVRLGTLMALDATVCGIWGCLPELFAPTVELVRTGKVKLRPFARSFPMDSINEVLEASREHKLKERPVLIP